MVIFLALLPFPIPISFGEDWSSYLLTCKHTTHTHSTHAHIQHRIVQLYQCEVKKVALKSQCASKEANVQLRVRRLIYWQMYEKGTEGGEGSCWTEEDGR